MNTLSLTPQDVAVIAEALNSGTYRERIATVTARRVQGAVSAEVGDLVAPARDLTYDFVTHREEPPSAYTDVAPTVRPVALMGEGLSSNVLILAAPLGSKVEIMTVDLSSGGDRVYQQIRTAEAHVVKLCPAGGG